MKANDRWSKNRWWVGPAVRWLIGAVVGFSLVMAAMAATGTPTYRELVARVNAIDARLRWLEDGDQAAARFDPRRLANLEARIADQQERIEALEAEVIRAKIGKPEDRWVIRAKPEDR